MTKLNRNGEIGHPWRTPLEIPKDDDNLPYTLTLPEVCEYIVLRMDKYFLGTPYLCKHCHSAVLSTESKAARMSRNTTTVDLL